MIEVDAESFLIITGAALVAAITFAALPNRIVPPVVVLELLLGILIGPQVLALAQSDEFTEFFGNLGLGMLFFFAGYEIDFALYGEDRSCSREPAGCCRSRSPTESGGARGGRSGAVAPVHWIGARHDRDRNSDPDPA